MREPFSFEVGLLLQVEVTQWVSSKHNMGMAFNRYYILYLYSNYEFKTKSKPIIILELLV